MSESTVVVVVAAFIGMVVGIALVILYKRGIIDSELIHGASSVMEQIPLEDSSIFGLILKYSRTAVNAVEQLVQNGEISRDSKARKDAAMRMVENAMIVDGFECGSEERYAISNCIEAEVYNLPRNQGHIMSSVPPDNGTDDTATLSDPE